MTSPLCAFAGPSLGRVHLPEDITIYEPARLGSIWHAVQRGHRRIALVDGVFGNQPAVWHKEILYALSLGCTVIGAASMGALRAAELAPYGMVGVGAIYRLYRCGAIVDDAEVALLHADDYDGAVELTVPLIDLRFTLRRLRRLGRVSTYVESLAFQRCAAIHFTERDWATIDQALSDNIFPVALGADLRHHRVHRKQLDARLALSLLRNIAPPAVATRWHFPQTTFWQQQFAHDADTIPPLRLLTRHTARPTLEVGNSSLSSPP